MRGTHQRDQAATRARSLPLERRRRNEALGRARRHRRQHRSHNGKAIRPVGASTQAQAHRTPRRVLFCGNPLTSIPETSILRRKVARAFGVAHLPGPLRDNCCSASKLSAALWSKTSARCLAFSSGHVSTVDSVPSGAIRTTCHPRGLASYRSRFISRICAPTRSFSSPEVCHNRHRGRSGFTWAVGQTTLASPALAPSAGPRQPATPELTGELPRVRKGHA